MVQLVRGVPQYDELAADSVDANLLGVPGRVCSLVRLREMKRARGRTQDLADLEHLSEAGVMERLLVLRGLDGRRVEARSGR
jgi:hypothetical protein